MGERTDYLSDMVQPYNKKVWTMEMQEKQKLKRKTVSKVEQTQICIEWLRWSQ